MAPGVEPFWLTKVGNGARGGTKMVPLGKVELKVEQKLKIPNSHSKLDGTFSYALVSNIIVFFGFQHIGPLKRMQGDFGLLIQNFRAILHVRTHIC